MLSFILQDKHLLPGLFFGRFRGGGVVRKKTAEKREGRVAGGFDTEDGFVSDLGRLFCFWYFGVGLGPAALRRRPRTCVVLFFVDLVIGRARRGN